MSSDRRASRSEQIRLAALVAALVLAIVFALVNLDKVKVDWVVTTTQTALVVVIFVAFGLGVATGALLMRRRARR